MSSLQNRIVELNECIKKHLVCESPQWSDACELRESSDFGCGLYATRDIKQDEVLFYDKPLMLGPSGNHHEPICCVVCYKLFSTPLMCPNECGLPLCISIECSEIHQAECQLFREWQPKNPRQVSFRRLKALFVIRGLFLSDTQKKFLGSLQRNYTNIKKDINFIDEFEHFPVDKTIVDELRASAASIHTNAFMLLYRVVDTRHVNVRGFYPIVSLMNHNCLPNIRRDIDKTFRYKIAAARPIQCGEQLFISYTQLLWATNSRRLQILISKQFLCTCPRCLDPLERGTHLSAIRCENKQCRGILLPIVPLNFRSDAKCSVCQQICESKRFLRVHEVVSTMVKNCSTTQGSFDLDTILRLMQSKLGAIVPECSQYIIELKLEAIWKHAAATSEGIFAINIITL